MTNKIILIGANTIKTITFDEPLIAQKIHIENKRPKYYDMRYGKITRSWTPKDHRFIDHMIRNNRNNGKKIGDKNR